VLQRKGNFPLDLFRTLLAQIHWPLDTMYFGWSGEPLLNREAPTMIGLTSRRGIKTHLNTNGMLVRRFAEPLLDSGLNFIGIDLDGVNQKTLVQYRVRGAWQEIVAGVERLASLKLSRGLTTPRLALQMIVMKQTESQVDEFIALAHRTGADEVFLKSFNIDLGNWMSDEDHRRMAERFLPEDRRYLRYVVENGRVRVRPEIVEAKCPEAHGGMTILQNGDAVICCLDFEGKNVLGNILVTPLGDIWRGSEYREMRKAVDARALDLCAMCTFPGGSKFNRTITLSS
jgi:MoaA/NifB/PqqE/SkfB family radical SAM enzyme